MLQPFSLAMPERRDRARSRRSPSALLIALTMLLTATVVTTTPAPPAEASAPAGCPTPMKPDGDGSSEEPYKVASIANLCWVAANSEAWSKHFQQTADIDLISIPNWTPIGNTGTKFRGTYDGDGHTIRNLTITGASDYRGLFGDAGISEIKQLRLENVDVSGKRWVAGLVGRIQGTSSNKALISDVSVTGMIRGTDQYVGGIAGQPFDALLNNRIVFVGEVHVTGTPNNVGGIAGRTSGETSVSVAYARGVVTGGNNPGGLIGDSSGGTSTFENMYSAVVVCATEADVERDADGRATGCTTGGRGDGGSVVGRISADDDKIKNSVYWDSDLTPEAYGVKRGTRDAQSLSTSKMQGNNALTEMSNLAGLPGTANPWRIVDRPDPDYPVFDWQRGDEITIDGTVTSDGGAVEGATVIAQSGDALFRDVLGTSNSSGTFSLAAYSAPTQRVFARGTSGGLPVGASVEGDFSVASVRTGIELDLAVHSLTVGPGSDAGWVQDGAEILAVEAGAVLNVDTLRDRLLAQSITVVAGVDIILDAALALTPDARRALTLRAGRDVVIADGASITSSGAPLDVVLWSDIDAADGGRVHVGRGATITTLGGHVWAGGGDEAAEPWNGLTVGDGYAIGETLVTTTSDHASVGVLVDHLATITTGAGDITLHGMSSDRYTGAGSMSPTSINVGVYLGNGAALETTSGDVTLDGVARLAEDQPSGGCGTASGTCGFRDGVLLHGGTTFTSDAPDAGDYATRVETTSGDVRITGVAEEPTGSGPDRMYSGGVTLYSDVDGGVSVESVVRTVSGSIEIDGDNRATSAPLAGAAGGVVIEFELAEVTSSSGDVTIRAELGHDGPALTLDAEVTLGDGTGDATLLTDTLLVDEFATDGRVLVAGSGRLRIAPVDPARTIGLAGAAGALSVPAALLGALDPDLAALVVGGPLQGGAVTLGPITTSIPLEVTTTGTVTQTGAIDAGSGLDVVGASSVILTDAGNAIGSLAANPVGTLRVVNGGALTLGAVDATGPVDVRTSVGDLTLAGSISTSATVGADGTGPALLVAAATSAPVGDTGSGDVTLGTGASLDLAPGARALLSTGVFDPALTSLMSPPATAVFDVAFADATNVADGVTVAFRDAPESAVGSVDVPTPTITSVTPRVGALELAFTADGAGDADGIEWSVDGGPWVRRAEASAASPVVVPTPGALTQRSVRLRFLLGRIPGVPSEPATGTPAAPPAPAVPSTPVAPPLPTSPVPTAGGTPPAPTPAPTARIGAVEVQVSATPAGTVRTEGTTTVSTATILEVGRVALALDVTDAGEVRAAPGEAPQVSVVRGTTARTSGSGMLPDTELAVWLPRDGSDVRRVTTLAVAADGTFTGTLPFDGSGDATTDGRPLPIGRQVLQLVGVDADGQLLVIEQTVTIAQPAPSPEPDRSAGAPPALTPGASIATNAGLPETVTVVPIPEVRQARVEGSGWAMAVDVPSAEGRVAPTDDGGALIELVADDVAEVSGDGFLPGTRADVWLFSTPTLLGSVTIGPDGTFTGAVGIDGERITIGEHTLQLQGVGRDGYVRAANLGVVVVPAAGPAGPAEPAAPEPDVDETPDAPAPGDAPAGPDERVEVVVAADSTGGTLRIVLLTLAVVALALAALAVGRARRGGRDGTAPA